MCDYVSWGRSGGLTYAYAGETKNKVVRARRAAALRAEATYEEHAPRPSW